MMLSPYCFRMLLFLQFPALFPSEMEKSQSSPISCPLLTLQHLYSNWQITKRKRSQDKENNEAISRSWLCPTCMNCIVLLTCLLLSLQIQNNQHLNFWTYFSADSQYISFAGMAFISCRFPLKLNR